VWSLVTRDMRLERSSPGPFSSYPYSSECVEEEFSEVALFSQFCYLGRNRSARERGERRNGAMPLFMDHHRNVEGLTAGAVADAHGKDVEVQDKYGVTYHRYWFNEDTGEVFCLAEAPSKEAMESVHREAHGLMADEITEVKEGS
jgi:uncharacterized protein DUF4242